MTTYLYKSGISRTDFIKTHLNETDEAMVTKSLRALFDILPHTFQYNLILVGPVGVGKSTVCMLLYYLIDKVWQEDYNTDVYCYPEFLQINYDKGHQMLKDHLEGRRSSFEFQRYILECWETLMSTQPLAPSPPTSRRFNIYERCCDDSVICFANLWHQLSPDTLNADELRQLFDISQDLDRRHNIPTYFAEDGVSIKKVPSGHIATILLDIIAIIRADFEDSNNTTTFVALEASVGVLVNRITKRSRPGEHAYDNETISAFHRHYGFLYNKLSLQGRLFNYDELSELI